MAQPKIWYFNVMLPVQLEQQLRSQSIASESEPLHAVILRQIKILSVYLKNPLLQELANDLKPAVEELYRLQSDEPLTTVSGAVKGEFVDFVREWQERFQHEYYERCDRTVTASVQTHLLLFLLQWSHRIPTDSLKSAEGKLRWIINFRAFRIGQKLSYSQIRKRLAHLHLPRPEVEQTLCELEAKGYLYPVHQTSPWNGQILLPLPQSAIAGEISYSKSANSRYRLSFRDHVIAGMAGQKSLPDEYIEIMQNLTQGQVYLIRKNGLIVSVMSHSRLANCHEFAPPVGSPKIEMNLNFFTRHEIQERIARVLHDMHKGLWGRAEMKFPTTCGVARYVAPEQLHFWHPAHYAIALNPRLGHWQYLIDDQTVYWQRYGHLLELLKYCEPNTKTVIQGEFDINDLKFRNEQQ